MRLHLLLTATHSLRSSPSGSNTASLRFPEPRVAAACFIRSYWCVPSGIFFLGLNVFDDLPPLQNINTRYKRRYIKTSNTGLTTGSSLWICLEHQPNLFSDKLTRWTHFSSYTPPKVETPIFTNSMNQTKVLLLEDPKHKVQNVRVLNNGNNLKDWFI